MDSTPDYGSLANTYAAGVRDLFAPSPTTAADAERGTRGLAPAPDLAAQAEQLLPVSRDLSQAGAARLAAADPAEREAAATQLLAQAWTDLQVSARLAEADQSGLEAAPATRDLAPERGAPALASEDLEQSLGVLTGAAAAIGGATRGLESASRELGAAPVDPVTARADLTTAITDTLALIEQRAAKTGQKALAGVLALPANEVLQAAGQLGLNVAGALGQGAQAAHLGALVGGFISNAITTLQQLLGTQALQMASDKVSGWIDDLRQGTLFADLLEKLYATKQTAQALSDLVSKSQAPVERLTAATTRVQGLSDAYNKQLVWVDKISGWLGFAPLLAGSVLPQARLAIATVYIILGAYTVLAGADYVDAQAIKVLNRVPGVREVVTQDLAGA